MPQKIRGSESRKVIIWHMTRWAHLISSKNKSPGHKSTKSQFLISKCARNALVHLPVEEEVTAQASLLTLHSVVSQDFLIRSRVSHEHPLSYTTLKHLWRINTLRHSDSHKGECPYATRNYSQIQIWSSVLISLYSSKLSKRTPNRLSNYKLEATLANTLDPASACGADASHP